ncbi:PepSY domain-containing protein [Aeromicrobium chenweiae]|uniref:Uncharacterized protein n=1 Tax=Aeromicrobium chenweiae TaxID=2079793 RepID=A0A2S0WR90_9ACTN|nr:PepSY domain-containing protein [Aeromicrobium chenweiae]AWB93859.1 hypothetical protein C3E78_17490 [Aeromicrobium chenweiae]TGN30904.1 hypothetical protein E4L97_14905 [Aeromicrobium chenweiae]
MRTPLTLSGLVLAAALTLSACAGDDDELSASDREKASETAIEYVGGGATTDVERGDGDDGYAYEVEITLSGGTDIEVELDKDFQVINNPPTIADLGLTKRPTPDATPTPRSDPDDRPLTGTTLKKATAAALKATDPEAKVTETSRSDDADHAYEVEVLLPNGQDATVELDRSFKVIRVDD